MQLRSGSGFAAASLVNLDGTWVAAFARFDGTVFFWDTERKEFSEDYHPSFEMLPFCPTGFDHIDGSLLMMWGGSDRIELMLRGGRRLIIPQCVPASAMKYCGEGLLAVSLENGTVVYEIDESRLRP